MLKILTYADIEQQTTHDPPLQMYLKSRFLTLYHTYCPNGSPPLGLFSLAQVGEIIIAESYGETEQLLFEQVEVVPIGTAEYYRCYWVRDNDRCCEVYLNKGQLSPQQILHMDKEC